MESRKDRADRMTAKHMKRIIAWLFAGVAALTLFVPFPSEVSPPWRVQVVDTTGAPVEGCLVEEAWWWTPFTRTSNNVVTSTDATGWATVPRQDAWFSLSHRLFGRASLVYSFHGSRYGPLAVLNAVSPSKGTRTVSFAVSTPGVAKERGVLTYRALLLSEAELRGLAGRLPPPTPPSRAAPTKLP
jgi:hypothetical protein